MDVVYADCQRVRLGNDELDQLGIDPLAETLAAPGPVLAGALHRREDRLDLHGTPFAVQNHLSPEAARVGWEGRLEPAEVNLLDKSDICRPRSLRSRNRFQPSQDVLPAVLNLLSGWERVVVKLG